MTKTTKRIFRIFNSAAASIMVFFSAAIMTLAVIVVPEIVTSAPVTGGTSKGNASWASVSSGPNGISISGEISHPKLVQGGDGTVYLELVVTPPDGEEGTFGKVPTDMVVVLDRSGSMSGADKLPLAKEAIIELLERLDSSDRFGLVAFDNSAVVYSELTSVTDNERSRLVNVVHSIYPGGSTNMSDGLERAMGLLQAGNSKRVKKIMLLSDGHANQGISDIDGLANIARRASNVGAVLSTIGLGLGFNENVVASLADHGMGNYAFLEHLGGLSAIFAKELQDSRIVFAEASSIELHLSKGVQIIDASGYPIDRTVENHTMAKIASGQLLHGISKRVNVTLRADTESLGESSLGRVVLRYRQSGESMELRLPREATQYAVVDEGRREEAIQAVKKSVLKNNWTYNNLGVVKREVSQALQAGDKDRAAAAIADYRAGIGKTSTEYSIDLADELAPAVAELEAEVDEVFSGGPAEQKEKQNRAAKELLSESRDAQRSPVVNK